METLGGAVALASLFARGAPRVKGNRRFLLAITFPFFFPLFTVHKTRVRARNKREIYDYAVHSALRDAKST